MIASVDKAFVRYGNVIVLEDCNIDLKTRTLIILFYQFTVTVQVFFSTIMTYTFAH